MEKIADYLEYKTLIQTRSEEIATQWYRILAKHSYLPMPSVQMEDIFTELVSRSVDILFSEPFDQDGAQIIGATIGELEHIEHRTLGDTQRLFAIEFMADLPPNVVAALHPALSKLMAEIAVGFFLSTKKNIIETQKELRDSVSTALSASEKRFQTLAELSPVAIFIYRNEKLLYTNNYFKSLSGFSAEDIEQLTVWDMLHPSHRDVVKTREKTVREGGVLPTRYEVKAQKKDGTAYWVELNFSGIQFRGEDAVLGTAFDITSRIEDTIEREKLLKNTQLEIQERIAIEAQLQKTEARNSALLAAMPDLLFRLSLDGTYLDYHANDARALFIPPEQFLNRRVADVMPIAIAEKTEAAIARVVETKKPTSINYDLVLDDKSINTFEARFTLSGKSEVVCTVRDITAQKAMERHAIQAERLAAIGQLAATLAHEMNNPLQAVLSNLDMISDFDLKKDELDKQVDIIQQEVNRLIKISQRMLSFASERPELRQPLSPKKVMDYTLSLLKKQIDLNHIKVKFVSARNTGLIMTGFNQLHQVFLNVLINAIEAVKTNKNSTRLIDISISSNRDFAKITISNNGDHIPNNIIAHLFEPFFSTKSDSTGLGLWTSYTFVQQHGGELSVKNIFGKSAGVMFVITLPIYKPPKELK